MLKDIIEFIQGLAFVVMLIFACAVDGEGFIPYKIIFGCMAVMVILEIIKRIGCVNYDEM